MGKSWSILFVASDMDTFVDNHLEMRDYVGLFFSSEFAHVVALKRQCRVLELAEEWKQCTKLANHTFTNQMRLQGIFFKFSLLSNLDMNPTEASNFL